MKLKNQISLISIGLALAIGGCIVGSSSKMASANAKVADTDTISEDACSEVMSGEYVVMGNSDGSKCVGSFSSDWGYLTSTKSDFLKFEVENTTDGFYLKDTDSGNYVYSSAAKKVALSSSDKSSAKARMPSFG